MCDHAVHTLVFELPYDLPQGAQLLVAFSTDETGQIRATLADRDEEWHSWGAPMCPVRVCDQTNRTYEEPRESISIDDILSDLKAREGRS